MKRNNSLKRKMTQFSYDHRELDNQLMRIRKSTGEVSKLLDKMVPKDKEEKNEEK
ncbi:hypothetical protein [Ruminococcus sp. 5_1_39BFAA]|uniref:hypothetical protein n=1 Tax=Ruminococcus sp. 5_1_39BFAA TaxID=457412 RepID=UPI003563A42B